MMILLVLAVWGMILQGTFIAEESRERYVPAVILKGSASLVFVLIGCIAYRSSTAAGGGRILAGLALGALGDILLNLRYLSEKYGQKIFLAGIAAFLAGHIMYLVAIIPLSDNLVISVIAGVVIAALLLAYIFRTMDVKTAFKIFGIFYIGAVVIMTAVAVGNYISVHDSFRLMFAAGAILFTVSDIVLIFNTFGGETKLSRRIINLSFYYAAQLLIAFSILFS